MMIPSSMRLVWIPFLWITVASGFVAPSARRAAAGHVLFSSTLADPTTTTTTRAELSPALRSTLQKPSKTLSILLEYNHRDKNDCDDAALATLSMQLRKVKASALVTRHLRVATIFCQEQETAVGNFPGPCPVLYLLEDGGDNDDNDDDATSNNMEAALQAGVSGVIVPAKKCCLILNDDATAALFSQTDVIIGVDNAQDVTLAPATTTAFLVNGNGDQDNSNMLEETIAAIRQHNEKAIIIAQLDSMQTDNAEVTRGKQLRQDALCCSVLLRDACVGDAEDLEYASFGIDSLTKKKSSTFNMSGLTGSTNGHFGGVASTQSTTWLRQQSR